MPGQEKFLCYYGVSFVFASQDAACGDRVGEDPRLQVAKTVGLGYHLGRVAPDEPIQLLVGTELGRFGSHDEKLKRLDDDSVRKVMTETRMRLRIAGFAEAPAMIFQMVSSE